MAKKELYEIRLAGFGGQGLVTAGMTFAQAVAFEGKYNVCNTQSYGPESRGGACKAEVIVSTDRIFYPKPEKVDILLALSQAAYDMYKDEIKEDTITLVDSDLVKTDDKIKNTMKIPFTKIAEDVTGIKITANVVALGAIYSLVKDVVKEDSLIEGIKSKVPRGTEEVNIKAFKAGFDAVKK